MSKKFSLNVLDRDPKEFTRQRSGDIRKVYHTQDATQHQFQKEREYTRALNATKLDKMFAKPFVAAFDSHTDGVYALSRVPMLLPYMLAGDADGVVKLWHLGTQKELWTAKAHTGRVRGLCAEPKGSYAISCAADKTVKLWNIDSRDESMSMLHSSGHRDEKIAELTPLQVFAGDSLFSGCDHHRKQPKFVTCGNTVDLWDVNRAEPLHSFQWGCDSILSVKYNYIDTDIIVSTGSDRSIVLYDARAKSPLHKIEMMHMNNSIAWNPQEAFNFVVGSEDTNCYTFDMRNLKAPSMVYQDHVAAVLAVDYSPTGREFVSGSYDKTIRLWTPGQQHSRDIYSTKRMQHIFSIQYSGDSKYVCSGSDDANVRVWKSKANEKMGVVERRELDKLDYQKKLKERYKHTQDISQIANRQLVPKAVKIQKAQLKIQQHSAARKAQNVAANKGKKVQKTPLRKTKVMEEFD